MLCSAVRAFSRGHEQFSWIAVGGRRQVVCVAGIASLVVQHGDAVAVERYESRIFYRPLAVYVYCCGLAPLLRSVGTMYLEFVFSTHSVVLYVAVWRVIGCRGERVTSGCFMSPAAAVFFSSAVALHAC